MRARRVVRPVWVRLVPALLAGTVLLAGCTRPAVIQLAVQSPGPAATAEDPAEAPTVRVVPFEDQRPVPGRLGVRTPLWGETQELRLAEPGAGLLAADLMAHVLRRNGWRAEVGEASGGAPQADVILTGEIQQLAVDAAGTLLETTISVETRVAVQALNTADQSRVRQTLTGVGSQGVFWFEPEDAERLLSEMLIESFWKLPATATIEDARLRLR